MQNHLTFRFQAALLITLTAVIAQPAGALVISEIMYNPGGDNEDLEFIELYNDRAVSEDMSGYAFTDGIDYTFDRGTLLGPKQYMVIARDPNAIEAVYGIDNVYGPYSGRLDNGGERVTLANENGGIFTSVRYNDRYPWPVAPDGTGHSLIRAETAGDPEQGSTWAASTFIGGTPGGPDETQGQSEDPSIETLIDIGHTGRVFKGTREPSPGPGGAPTIDWTAIQFNDNPKTTDWIEGPSGYGYSSESNERQFIRTELEDMRTGYLSMYVRLPFELTADQIASFSQMGVEMHYDDAFVLYLNGVRVGDSGTMPGNPPAHDQGAGSGADYGPTSVDLTGRMDLLVPGTNLLAVQAHNSALTSSDCIASPVLRAFVEPPSSGVAPEARLLINELLANSDAPPGVDWVELYNPGPEPINLGTVYFSDDSDELFKFKLPDGVVLQPGEFWTARQGVAPDGFEFGLSFSGETIYLTAAEMGQNQTPEPIRVLDAVNYDAAEPDVTLGRYPDGADGFKILSAATFKAANAKPYVHDIVINEIMYHHVMREDRYDYVELYNKGDTTVSLHGWAFTDGIEYTFEHVTIGPGDYIIVAKDPDWLANVYGNLTAGMNLFGPYSGNLDNHSECVRLSYPVVQADPDTGEIETAGVTADEVTYYDGGRWPKWSDGEGASMELRDPRSNNDSPDAWADSDERDKGTWQPFSFSGTGGSYSSFTNGFVTVFDMMLLNRGEILLDNLQVTINGSNRIDNGGFEGGQMNWRILGNHVRSFVTTADRHSGSRALHLIATGHGDPGANRINQSIAGANANSVTFSGWAKWLRGSRFLLMRTSRERSPVQPPWPSHAFELDMPLNIGTPGRRNTAFAANRGPDIADVRHAPILPSSGEPIIVTARVTDNDGIGHVRLYYRTEGAGGFQSTFMNDTGSADDALAGDGIFTGTIPGAGSGSMRAFYIEASDGSASTRFPTRLQPSAEVPERTCLVRVGDAVYNTEFATYRVWMSNDVVNTFRSRPNLSNELLDCTFVYDDGGVFYNCRIRHRGSPFLRNGSGRAPYPASRHGFRIEFNPDQRYRRREEINLDGTEGGGRGPLQERASYWFYRKMGLQYSRQEYIRPIFNGNTYPNYEDVQKIDGDYIEAWFPSDDDGYIHKIDDYFEYSIEGTSHSNLDEGLKSDAQHPPIKETYRWGFEKRSHRENDDWSALIDFAQAMNTSATGGAYEQAVESMLHPDHFARVLAIRHAVGDWDSYGYTRGKNNYFYYAMPEGKWYLLPWDIDFTLGSGRGAYSSLFEVDEGEFPEVQKFLQYPKYERLYLQAFAELVNGPWKTSYGTNNPPTEFDRFLDEAADALSANGGDAGRRNSIKSFVRDRRNYILTQLPSTTFDILTNNGRPICTSRPTVTILGIAPLAVSGIAVDGEIWPASLTESNTFTVDVPVEIGVNVLNLQGVDRLDNPVPGATDSIQVTRVPAVVIDSVSPQSICNNAAAELTIEGSGFVPGSSTTVAISRVSDEIGFDALYVQNDAPFGQVDAASLLLDNPDTGLADPTYTTHEWINLSSPSGQGVFPDNELSIAMPYGRIGINYALRLTGYVSVPSAGVRYFGVSSDEGFSLRIDGQLVGEYADPRSQATSDVTQNLTAGTMTYDFPAPGLYYVELDVFENDGPEEFEFFQTDADGNDPRLINVDAELVVYRADVAKIEATDVVVLDPNTITCRVDMQNAELGPWSVAVTPECGDIARYTPEEGLMVISCGYDFNGDSQTNFLDYSQVAGKWRQSCSQPDWCDGMDLDQSGSVDAQDLAIFAENWLGGG